MNKFIAFLTFVTIIVLAVAAFFFIGLNTIELPSLEYDPNPSSAQLKTNQNNSPVTVMFAGDIMFDRGIRYYAGQNGGNDYIFQNLSSLLQKNDLNVANLEGPITNNPSISLGSVVGSPENYKFTFDPSVADTLAKQNIKIVSLGNNHILNFGEEGIKSTTTALDKAEVGYFGVPYQKRSITQVIKGLKISLVNYNQFLQDPAQEKDETIAEIKKIRENSDIVIVFCHWGEEYLDGHTKEQQEFAHQFIDTGADLVIGTHPHVIEPSEDYQGKRIYYSIGNFIFDQYFNEDVRNGLGVIVSINPKTKELTFTEKKFYLQQGGQTLIK